MALTSEINRAATTEKRPIGSQAIDHYGIAEHIDDTEDISPDAALFVKRLGNKHDCAGTDCTNPQHVDDIAACNTTLILLGLAHDPYPSVERERRIAPDVKPVPQERRLKVAVEPRPDTSWQDDAECRDGDLGLFFGPDGEQRAEREAREAEARKVCLACPVRQECLDYAVSRPEKYGYWAAMTEDQRAGERRRRMRRANAA